MPDYSAFFLNGSAQDVKLITLEISHPGFTKTYRLVSNAIGGITATIEDGTKQVFDEYPFILSEIGLRDTLDFGFTVQLGDLGEIIPQEIDAVRASTVTSTHPAVVYRAFSSSDLSGPLEGPFNLRMVGPTVGSQGTIFKAEPLTANNSATGDIYSIERFPGLLGVI